MPGPVGGSFYSETTLTNYTYIYIKSVENALLQKSINSKINKTTTDLPIVNTPEDEKKNAIEKTLIDVQVEKDVNLKEDNSSQVPKKIETKESDPAVETTNVFSTNYENFFNKNVSPASAVDLVKNISNVKNNVLEKASETFPGNNNELFVY